MENATFPSIPAETISAALAFFGRNNFYISIGDHAAELFTGLRIADLPGDLTRLPVSAPMLFLFTIFQYIESLPDRQAIDAVRGRVDLKYALHLPMNFLEMETTKLCVFRRWLRSDPDGLQALQMILERMAQYSAVHSQRSPSQDAAGMVNHLCWLNRTSEIWETMSHALGAVVMTDPAWLRANSQAHWYGRYSPSKNRWGERFEKPDWEEFVLSIGRDGCHLLEAVTKAGKPELAELAEIKTLIHVWQEQYEQVGGNLVWRREYCAECSLHPPKEIEPMRR